MRKLLLFSIFLLISFLGWTTDFQRKIIWHFPQTGQGVERHTLAGLFEGAVWVGESNLPFWVESFEIQSSSAKVVISNAVFETIIDPSFTLPDTINSDLKFSTHIGTSAGTNHLRVSVFPFVKRNGQNFRLIEFSLRIQEHLTRLKSAKLSNEWPSSSVLGSGKWTKIKTKDKGIYKITYDQLRAWGFANPDQVSVYGNGGYMLPVLNRDLKAYDLMPYPIWKGKDNGNKDCLFLYSSGNIKLNYNSSNGTFSHQQNYYSTETYFYLSDKGPQLLIQRGVDLSESVGRQVLTFPNYTFHEKELNNLIHSGSQWFGEQFNMNGSQTLNIALDNPDLSKSASITVSAVGRSSSNSSMDVALNGQLFENLSFGAYGTYEHGRKTVKTASVTLPGKSLQIKLTYKAANSVSSGWLDYIGINYQSPLTMTGDVLHFRGRGVDGIIPVSEFVVSSSSSNTKVWDITDFPNMLEVPGVFAGGKFTFKSGSSQMNDYVAFNPGGNIPSPDLVGDVVNQNLHAADLPEMIIVVHPEFLNEANRLADYHRNSDQMNIQVVTPQIIYNEFSGGLPDPAGLRNYFRMFYERGIQSGANSLKYVLLFGDGSYDNRNILGKNLNLLPTFQSEESLSLTDSYVTDDFFVMLDENEGGVSGVIDLGIGRIPANTIKEAQAVVDKIYNYHKQDAMGNWRNMVTFIADDGNSADGFTNIHQLQAEELASFINKTYPAFFPEKIFFDTYKRMLSAGGEKYPEVTEAITSRVKRGTLIMNYTGHANERNLADEAVLDIGIINSMTNYNKLPLFVTATCEYSRFDLNETSAGEHILFNPTGGGIGLFSTTRLVYSGANATLNKRFFENVFKKDDQGNNLRLGDVMRLAKAAANTGTNQLNFTLLADPALRLAHPQLKVMTTSIDGVSTEIVDTIRTLSVVKVKGFVADSYGVKLGSFNGEIIPTVYDKAMTVKTLGNAGQNPMDYVVQNNIIYRGLASVKDGEFEFSFFVPKDISYKLDKGKILYYAYNETHDAQGYFDGFYIGGASSTTLADSQGPAIDLFMNSNSFQDGGQVSANAVLIANITDETGINTAGIGIGHDITGVLDGDFSNILVLNDYFQASKDKHTEGSIVFPLIDLVEGPHTLTIKVWDVLNNSSEKEIRFVVKDNFTIESVECYPNPMQQQTSFVFTHNQPDESFKVTLEIFLPSGERVDMLQANMGSRGTESFPLVWNPSQRDVIMKAGVYIYRMTVTTDVKTDSASGRLVFVYR